VDVLYGVASVLLGGGILAFIQFMVNRHDQKHDKLKKVFDAIENLSKKIDSIDAKSDERNAVAARVRILRFADEMMENRKHSKDSWDQCLSDITEYDKYCDKHPDFKNNQTAVTVEYLQKSYRERLEKQDFL